MPCTGNRQTQSEPKTTVQSMRGGGGGVSAGGGGTANRNAIVREVMQKQGLSLPRANKYAKEHNPY